MSARTPRRTDPKPTPRARADHDEGRRSWPKATRVFAESVRPEPVEEAPPEPILTSQESDSEKGRAIELLKTADRLNKRTQRLHSSTERLRAQSASLESSTARLRHATSRLIEDKKRDEDE